VLQIQIRTARFLQVFAAIENSLCLLFHDNAAKQLCDIFREYDNVRTANQLANRIYDAFALTLLVNVIISQVLSGIAD